MKEKSELYSFECPIEITLDAIGGKWKGVIIYYLLTGTKRFNELHRLMPAITQRMLTRQLRELESAHIVLRVVYAEVPPRVEYSLTEHGQALEPLMQMLQAWGEKYLGKAAAGDNQ